MKGMNVGGLPSTELAGLSVAKCGFEGGLQHSEGPLALGLVTAHVACPQLLHPHSCPPRLDPHCQPRHRAYQLTFPFFIVLCKASPNPTNSTNWCRLVCSYPPETRLQLEARARQLEGKEMGQASAQVRGKPDTPKYDRERQGSSANVVSAPKAYNADADVTMDVKPEAVKEKKKVRKMNIYVIAPQIVSVSSM